MKSSLPRSCGSARRSAAGTEDARAHHLVTGGAAHKGRRGPHRGEGAALGHGVRGGFRGTFVALPARARIACADRRARPETGHLLWMLERRETVGHRRRPPSTWGALLATLLAGLACRKPPPNIVVYDLAEAAHAAELTGPWEALLFGTPAAAANENKGLLEGSAPSQTDVHAPSLRKVRVLFAMGRPHPPRGAPGPGSPSRASRTKGPTSS